MQRAWFGAVLLVALLAPQRAVAQTGNQPFAFGVVGSGCFADDEGWLGCGLVLGGGGGVRVGTRLQFEGSVTTVPHEQVASITWEGRTTIATGRALYRFGAPASRARAFVGAGAGVGRYEGTRTDVGFSVPGFPQRDTTVVPLDSTGLATEFGGGADISSGSRLFIRPEAWLVWLSGKAQGGLEPAFLVPRVSVSVGVRF